MRLGLAGAAGFLLVAVGIWAVKAIPGSKPTPEAPKEVAQTQWVKPNFNAEPPAESKPPVVVPARAEIPKDLFVDPPMTPADPAPKTPPAIDLPPIILPPEPVKKDPALILPPEDPVPPPRPADDFSKPRDPAPPIVIIDVPRKKEPKLDPPLILEPPPEVRNPVIRVGGSEPKKDVPPRIDLPPIEAPVIPPPVAEPMKKDPLIPIDPPPVPEPKKKDPLIPIDPPPVPEPKKKDPLIPIDPPPVPEPMKKDVPPLKIDLPIDPPIAVDPPKKQDPPRVDPGIPVIDLSPKREPETPMKKDQPPSTNGDYDEDMHSLRPNETYRSISKQYYNSEAYAIALQRYNRDHPGQADYVRIPPIWVLEKKYAGDVASNPTRATNYAPPPVTAAGNEQVYTVADNGEMLADIAKKALGGEDQWKRIWDLNPQINPARTIPGGTRLRLP